MRCYLYNIIIKFRFFIINFYYFQNKEFNLFLFFFDCSFNDIFYFLINELKYLMLILIINAFKFKILFFVSFAFANIVFLSTARKLIFYIRIKK